MCDKLAIEEAAVGPYCCWSKKKQEEEEDGEGEEVVMAEVQGGSDRVLCGQVVLGLVMVVAAAAVVIHVDEGNGDCGEVEKEGEENEEGHAYYARGDFLHLLSFSCRGNLGSSVYKDDGYQDEARKKLADDDSGE